MDSKTLLKGRISAPEVVGEGVDVPAQGHRDGSMWTADWRLRLVLEGRVCVANVGTASTPVTFVTFSDLRPNLNVDVAAGMAVIPIELAFHLETSAGTLNEVIAGISRALRGVGTSTIITPQGYRTGLPVGRPVSVVRSLYSADGAASVDLAEVYRSGYAFADTSLGPVKTFVWRPDVPCVVDAGHAFSAWMSATTTQATGFATLIYAEVPASRV